MEEYIKNARIYIQEHLKISPAFLMRKEKINLEMAENVCYSAWHEEKQEAMKLKELYLENC